VLRYLSPLEVSRLSSAMRELEVLPRERVRAILRDYAAEAAEQTGFAADTGRFLDETLKLALSPERAQAMLQRWARRARRRWKNSPGANRRRLPACWKNSRRN
jgi:flagellar motor switch protein FliG